MTYPEEKNFGLDKRNISKCFNRYIIKSCIKNGKFNLLRPIRKSFELFSLIVFNVQPFYNAVQGKRKHRGTMFEISDINTYDWKSQ